MMCIQCKYTVTERKISEYSKCRTLVALAAIVFLHACLHKLAAYRTLYLRVWICRNHYAVMHLYMALKGRVLTSNGVDEFNLLVQPRGCWSLRRRKVRARLSYFL